VEDVVNVLDQPASRGDFLAGQAFTADDVYVGSHPKGQRLPGATSRWNRGKDLSWEPLRPERVCEVAYDHMQGTRFRHAAKFLRWRPDKRPQDCRYDQLEVSPAYELDRVFGARDRSQRCAPASQGS
jgi:hypothetical protein